MAKIIVAFSDIQLARQISQALESAGFEVFRTCLNGNEVMRAFNICQDGILVCGTRFPDRTVDTLAWDLEKRAVVLAVGKGEQLDALEHPDIYTLKVPFSRNELTATVNVMQQLHYKRLPRRSAAEKDLIEKAKEALMRKHGIPEAIAHQLMQRESMRSGIKMIDYAQMILDKETGE